MKPLLLAGLFLGFWGSFGSAFPQQQVESPQILSAKTVLVTLPVTVVDRDGEFVTGLRQEDFTVYDNGEPQAIELFASEDLPATIGLVIDSSGSMRDRRDEVTAAGAAFAAMSHPLDEFFTLNFNEAVWPGLPPGVPFTGQAGELRAALAAAPTQGLSAVYDAIDRALAHLRLGTRDRKAVIVVSDGGDNASAQTLEGVLEHARRANAVIYAVTIFDRGAHDAKPGVLKKLAAETGGHAFTPRRADDVLRSFAQIARELRSGYTIGFRPPDTAAGGYRTVRVVVDAHGNRPLVARTRAGYHAGPSAGTAR